MRGLLAELAERGLKVDYRSVWNFVYELTYRKTVVASERDRFDIARGRAQWTKYRGRIKPERLIFVDETWTKTNMVPFRGWAQRTRLYPFAQHKRALSWVPVPPRENSVQWHATNHEPAVATSW